MTHGRGIARVILIPRAVPAVIAGAGGADVEPVGPGGITVVLLTAMLGLAATVVWWERADQAG
jgi:hypothetical protein